MLLFRRLLMIICLLGFVAVAYAWTLPTYHDQTAADNVMAQFIIKATQVRPTSAEFSAAADEFHAKDKKLRTSRNYIMDIGTGLALASGVLSLFLWRRNIRTWTDLKNIQSFGRWKIVILSNLAWLMLIPGTVFYYIFRSMRGDYPSFSDSINLPVMTEIPTLIVALVPLNIFLLMTLCRARLPATVFARPVHNDWKTILREVFFGFWLLVNGLFFISFVLAGDHVSLLVNMVFTWILLNLRAGRITKNS